jgi:hypothetical protein
VRHPPHRKLHAMPAHKGVLHFWCFAKYAAAFFRMANSSVCSAS